MEPDRPERQLQHSLLPEPAYHADPAAQLGATLFAAPQRPAPGDNIGLLIEDRNTGGTLFYAPGLGQVSEELLATMRRADCLLVDGTLWRDDEMLVREVGTKLGSEMGHLQQSGPGGMIEVLDGMPAVRKILIHINNTNPILDEDSVEREILGEHGIEVAYDGMNIEL